MTTSYKEERKVQMVVSEQKRQFLLCCLCVGDAIRDARRNHERKMKAYEDMCMDDPFQL